MPKCDAGQFLSLPKIKIAGFRNNEWKDDLILKEALQKHVKIAFVEKKYWTLWLGILSNIRGA